MLLPGSDLLVSYLHKCATVHVDLVRFNFSVVRIVQFAISLSVFVYIDRLTKRKLILNFES